MSNEEKESPNWKQDFPIQKQVATQVSRRDFAKFLCLVSGGLAFGTGAVALKANFFPPEKVEGEHFVCKIKDIPVGGTQTFVIEGSKIPYMLIHLEDGTFRAYEQKCTHLSCAVFYKPGTGQIHCPCHEGLFDADSGNVLAGPPPRPLPKLEVVVKEESIYVTASQEKIS